MFITKAFSVILVYALFATANGAGVHDDLSGALTRLEVIKANIAKAEHARDVTTPAAMSDAVTSDISSIVDLSTELASAIVALVTDLGPDPLDKRSTDNIRSDALTLSAEMKLIISDIAKLAADAGVPDDTPAPKIPGFPF